MLGTVDFGPNPPVPAYKGFGCAEVRFAKGTSGSGPLRRTILQAWSSTGWLNGGSTRRGEPYSSRLTSNQRCARSSLQHGYLMRDRRLRQIQQSRCLSD